MCKTLWVWGCPLPHPAPLWKSCLPQKLPVPSALVSNRLLLTLIFPLGRGSFQNPHTLFLCQPNCKNKLMHLIFWLLCRHVRCSEKDLLEVYQEEASQSPCGGFLKVLSSRTDFPTKGNNGTRSIWGLVLYWQVDRFFGVPMASGMERTLHY